MDNLFAFLNQDLPDDLKRKIIQAHHAKLSDKAISKYLGISIAEVKRVIAQDALQQRKTQELAQWAALIG